MKMLVAILLCVAAATPAQAQVPGVWRCGPDGSSYSDTPCPGGRAVQVADERSAQQRQQAVQVAAADRAIARRMVDERREREREWAARGTGLIAVGPVAATRPQAIKPTERQAGKKKPERSSQKASQKASRQTSTQASDLAARGTSPSAAGVSRRKKD